MGECRLDFILGNSKYFENFEISKFARTIEINFYAAARIYCAQIFPLEIFGGGDGVPNFNTYQIGKEINSNVIYNIPANKTTIYSRANPE